MNNTFNICVYCGEYAQYQLKNGKWCCSKSHNECPEMKQKNSIQNTGKKFSSDHKKKISSSKKGSIPWNKGKKGLQAGWNKGKKLPNLSKKTKEKISGSTTLEKNGNWKGGYSLINIATYDFFYNKLTIDEAPKRYLLDENILTVLCSHCNDRYIPILSSVRERVRSLNGMNHGEQRLYCSENCKKECSVFGKKNYQENHPQKNNKVYTSTEYKTFREYVLKRDNYKCQYCDEKADHVHHERPQKLEPFHSLDPDYAWSVCKQCHYEKAHTGECSTGKLANKIC